MTDQTPIPRAAVCHVDDCAVMYPDTIKDAARHRRGHEHREKVDDAIRRALRTLSTRMDEVVAGNREAVATMRDDIGAIERLVSGIEVPEQLPQLEIVRPATWEDDDADEPDDTAAQIDDDWDALTIPADQPDTTTPERGSAAPESDEPAEVAQGDPDENLTPHTPAWRR